MNTVFCPVTGGQVDGTTCLEIVLVADHEAKPSILPNGITWSDEQRERCLKCPYHADLESSEE